MDETQKQDAAAKKRSDAAKKAAETRRRNAEAEEAQSASQVQPEQPQAEATGALQPDEQSVVQAEDAPEEQSKEQAAPQQTEWEQMTGRRADVRVDDHVFQEAQKQTVLDAERRYHNARTAGKSV